MPRIAGRQKGTGNLSPLERIKANQHKLEKLLLDKALTGDVEAIAACLELISKPSRKRAPAPATSGA